MKSENNDYKNVPGWDIMQIMIVCFWILLVLLVLLVIVFFVSSDISGWKSCISYNTAGVMAGVERRK